MTPAQFARAVGADPLWIRNARRTLGRTRRNDASEARWFGLVHDLHASLGVALRDAARIADRTIDASEDQRFVEFVADRSMSISVAIDLARACALHELRLAAALYLPAIDQRGRPATSYRAIVADLVRSARRRSDPIRLALSAKRPAADRLAALGSLAELLVGFANANVRFIAIGEVAGALFGTLCQPSVVDLLHDASDNESLDAAADLLTRWHARPRGADQGHCRAIDAAMLSALPALALDTDLGPLNLWTRCHVVGDYAGAAKEVLDGNQTGFPFPVLDLKALAAMERGIGRRKDPELLYEFRQLAVERERAARLERYLPSISSSSAATLA